MLISMWEQGWDNQPCRDAINAWNLRQGAAGQETRSDYKICPFCGASLDVGERCDCRQEKQPQKCPRTHETGQGYTNTHRHSKAA